MDQALEKIPKAVAGKKHYYVISKKIEQLYQLNKHGIDFGDEIILVQLVKPKGREKFTIIFTYQKMIFNTVMSWHKKE